MPLTPLFHIRGEEMAVDDSAVDDWLGEHASFFVGLVVSSD